MGVLFDPFRLFGRLMLLMFRLLGYTFTFCVQVVGFVRCGRRDKIFDAFGGYGRGVTDALADTFRGDK
jgi:hypothetical protein